MEAREKLSVSPWTINTFEGGQAGSLPLDWSQWNSQVGYSQFAVSNKNNSPNNPALSGSQSISVTRSGGSGDVSRAWINQTMPAGEYLDSSGQWQTAQTWALTVIDASISGPGVVGLGRPSSYTGTATFDDFNVQVPATDRAFDATPVGSLPDNWSQWSNDGTNYISVTNPPAGQNEFSAIVDRIFSLWTEAKSDLDRVFYPWMETEMKTAFAWSNEPAT